MVAIGSGKRREWNIDSLSIKAEIKVPKSVEKRSGIQHIDKVIERWSVKNQN